MEPGGAEAHHLGAAVLRHEDIAIASDHVLGRGAVAWLPLCLDKVVDDLVDEAQDDVDKVEDGEDNEAYSIIQHSTCQLQQGQGHGHLTAHFSNALALKFLLSSPNGREPKCGFFGWVPC